MVLDANPNLRRYDSILDTVGNTPLVRLRRVTSHLPCPTWAKVEYMNPGGSVKDRMVMHILHKAEASGELRPGGTIVENTSGNTGAAVAMAAAARGYKAILTVPDKMSTEKINTLKAFGARVVVTPTAVPADSPQSYYEVAKRIVRETSGSFYVDQYQNPVNIEAHYLSTGPELWEQTEGMVDCLIGGVGTGGTMSGAGRFLKEKNADIRVIGVDAEGSVYTDWFKENRLVEPKAYKVEGIGEDMLAGSMDFSVFDDIVQVSDKECFQMARRLTLEEGLFVGGSAGGAVAGALKHLAEHSEYRCPVILLPDAGIRYLSKVFNDEWMRDNGFLDEPSRLGTVADLLAARESGVTVVTASKNEKLFEVVDKLKKHGISQVVVVDGDELLGVVHEADLLRHMMRTTHSIVAPVGTIVTRAVLTVTPATPLQEVSEAFTTEGRKMAVVKENGKIRAVVTKIDLIDYMASRFRE